MSGLQLLLVSNNLDIMVVASPFCRQCFEFKTDTKILKDFPLSMEEYKELLKNGVQRGVRIKCECPTENKIVSYNFF